MKFSWDSSERSLGLERSEMFIDQEVSYLQCSEHNFLHRREVRFPQELRLLAERQDAILMDGADRRWDLCGEGSSGIIYCLLDRPFQSKAPVKITEDVPCGQTGLIQKVKEFSKVN